MSYKIKGKIIQILPSVKVSEKLSYVEVILEVQSGAYTSTPGFQFQNQYADLCQNFEVGQEVEIFFDVKGRYHEPTGKNFTNVTGWKIDFVGVGDAPKQQAQRAAQPKQQPTVEQQGVDDDLPF